MREPLLCNLFHDGRRWLCLFQCAADGCNSIHSVLILSNFKAEGKLRWSPDRAVACGVSISWDSCSIAGQGTNCCRHDRCGSSLGLTNCSSERGCRRTIGTKQDAELSLPRPRIQLVHGTVPRQCAGSAPPARPGIPCRPAIAGLHCHPLPTSSMRAPEVTPN